jgi:hypothetical protein
LEISRTPGLELRNYLESGIRDVMAKIEKSREVIASRGESVEADNANERNVGDPSAVVKEKIQPHMGAFERRVFQQCT